MQIPWIWHSSYRTSIVQNSVSKRSQNSLSSMRHWVVWVGSTPMYDVSIIIWWINASWKYLWFMKISNKNRLKNVIGLWAKKLSYDKKKLTSRTGLNWNGITREAPAFNKIIFKISSPSQKFWGYKHLKKYSRIGNLLLFEVWNWEFFEIG